MTTRWPTLYLSHGGGPCFWMDWGGPNPFEQLGVSLRGLAASLGPKPKAILAISAHWEEADFTLQSSAHPGLLYDYSGFPPHTYALKYPAPGSRWLVDRVAQALSTASLPVREDPERGFDHGVFVPLLLVYPQADVPVVQLSLRRSLDPGAHLALGRALAPLREEGVLILGSGSSYHDLRFRDADGASHRWDAWLQAAVTSKRGAEREALLEHWAQAPGARQSHPREEHLLPLMVAVGAAAQDEGRVIYSERMSLGGVSMSSFQLGAAVTS